MKKFTILALVFCFSFPAMANQTPDQNVGIENLSSDQALEMYQLEDESKLTPSDEKAFFRCFARPRHIFFRRYVFWGNGFLRGMAARRAIRTCRLRLRRMSYIGYRYGCQLIYCRRFFK